MLRSAHSSGVELSSAGDYARYADSVAAPDDAQSQLLPQRGRGSPTRSPQGHYPRISLMASLGRLLLPPMRPLLQGTRRSALPRPDCVKRCMSPISSRLSRMLKAFEPPSLLILSVRP